MKEKSEEKCVCPYCEEEIIISFNPVCQPCNIVFPYCHKCELTVLDKEATHCPKCGEPLS